MEKEKVILKNIKPYERSVQRRFLNYRLILFLVLGAITLMFVSLSLLYVFSKPYSHDGNLQLPRVFIYNTITLVLSSIALFLAKKAFYKDNPVIFKGLIYITGSLGIVFLAAQAWGVKLLHSTGFDLIRHNAASYLWVIAAFHAAHLIAGIAFWIYYVFKINKGLSDYAFSPFFFSDPVTSFQLSLFSIYWHFLGGVWLYLLIFFLILK